MDHDEDFMNEEGVPGVPPAVQAFLKALGLGEEDVASLVTEIMRPPTPEEYLQGVLPMMYPSPVSFRQ